MAAPNIDILATSVLFRKSDGINLFFNKNNIAGLGGNIGQLTISAASPFNVNRL